VRGVLILMTGGGGQIKRESEGAEREGHMSSSQKPKRKRHSGSDALDPMDGSVARLKNSVKGKVKEKLKGSVGSERIGDSSQHTTSRLQRRKSNPPEKIQERQVTNFHKNERRRLKAGKEEEWELRGNSNYGKRKNLRKQ